METILHSSAHFGFLDVPDGHVFGLMEAAVMVYLR